MDYNKISYQSNALGVVNTTASADMKSLGDKTIGFSNSLYGPYSSDSYDNAKARALRVLIKTLDFGIVNETGVITYTSFNQIPRGFTVGLVDSTGIVADYWLPGSPSTEFQVGSKIYKQYTEADFKLKSSGASEAGDIASSTSNGLMSSADYVLLQNLKNQALSLLTFKGTTSTIPPTLTEGDSYKTGYAYRFGSSTSGTLEDSHSASGSSETVSFGDLLICTQPQELYVEGDTMPTGKSVGDIKTSAKWTVINANLDDDYFKELKEEILVEDGSTVGSKVVYLQGSDASTKVKLSDVADSVATHGKITSYVEVYEVDYTSDNAPDQISLENIEGTLDKKLVITRTGTNTNSYSEFVLTTPSEAYGEVYISAYGLPQGSLKVNLSEANTGYYLYKSGDNWCAELASEVLES